MVGPRKFKNKILSPVARMMPSNKTRIVQMSNQIFYASHDRSALLWSYRWIHADHDLFRHAGCQRQHHAAYAVFRMVERCFPERRRCKTNLYAAIRDS